VWTRADKQGFGTAVETTSRVWYTLSRGELTEVYFPRIDTPAVRDLELVVSDGRGPAERESTATRSRVELADPRSLTYRQVNTDRQGRYRITKTYVTDPARDALLVDVRVESLDGRARQVHVLHDPALSNDGDDDRARVAGSALVAEDDRAAVALRATPALRRASVGYLGESDGWRDLRRDGDLDDDFARADRRGNVVHVARTALTGRAGAQRMTLALGFGRTARGALTTSGAALARGFADIARDYAAGWHGYLDELGTPAAAAPHRNLYDASLMVLRAAEDKTRRGASVASPSMPWAWSRLTVEEDLPSGAYHLVWARDLYQVATAHLAAGDRAAAERSLDWLLFTQQKRDGSFPQNSFVDGEQRWERVQMDQAALPLVLAWQLGRTDARTWARVRRSADFLLREGPNTEQERWENQSGWSPSTIAAEIAGLVCAAEIARANGDTARAGRYLATADAWQRDVERWTATTNGPLSDEPYYLRVTKDRAPNRPTTFDNGDSGPSRVDQRRVVDVSFLELVRLGVKRWDDPVVRNTLVVVDDQLGTRTALGRFWHRFSFDGYGETRRGRGWDIGEPDTYRTFGRLWPIFAGERGEYELLSGEGDPRARLADMARTANEGLMLPEQVWDTRPPADRPGVTPGTPNFSATPLAWTHAQFIRLAWSIDAGRPVEQPSVVAERYAR
jgi:glucoamylase